MREYYVAHISNFLVTYPLKQTSLVLLCVLLTPPLPRRFDTLPLSIRDRQRGGAALLRFFLRLDVTSA